MGRGLIAWATLEAPHGSPPLFSSLARSAPPPSFQAATAGEWRRPASSSLDASPATRYVRAFPSLPFLLRNRTPETPNLCYLYSDLTMYFTYKLRVFLQQLLGVYVITHDLY